MEDQKVDELLNLAMDATEEEREKSIDLETGYDSRERTWELIVRYTGDLQAVYDMGIRGEELLGGYAVLYVPQELIGAVSALPQISYIEKPKRLFFAVYRARAASCLTPMQDGGLGLSGKGVLVAVLDSGIDYLHQDFCNRDGSTRILYLWDQTLDQVFDRDAIDEALRAAGQGRQGGAGQEGQGAAGQRGQEGAAQGGQETVGQRGQEGAAQGGQGGRAAALRLVPSVDSSGHGTAVAGIAAGNGRESQGRYRGVAYESQLLVVKLGTADPQGFPRTTQLMRALDFVLRKAVELARPVAVNISFGNTYGSHDGTSLLETFIDGAADYGRNVIVIGTGNEGGSGGHAAGQLAPGQSTEVLLSVAPYETSFSVQLWKSFADQFRVSLMTPSGERLGPFSERLGTQRFAHGKTQILVYHGSASPYSQAQEIYMDFIPEKDYIDSGIWRILLEPVRLVTGQYDLWLPSHGILNPSTRFLSPSPETTLTIPSTAAKAISVGAYDPAYQAYADFSGRGYTRLTDQIKPELAAPGTDIVTVSAGGGYTSVTGTSFAAPFVTGTAALMMEWGVVQGEDPYLFGEKVKAYLIRGARQLPGFTEWPNRELGYGALCGGDSLPV